MPSRRIRSIRPKARISRQDRRGLSEAAAWMVWLAPHPRNAANGCIAAAAIMRRGNRYCVSRVKSRSDGVNFSRSAALGMPNANTRTFSPHVRKRSISCATNVSDSTGKLPIKYAIFISNGPATVPNDAHHATATQPRAARAPASSIALGT